MRNFSREIFEISVSCIILKLAVFLEKLLTRAGRCALRREQCRVPSLSQGRLSRRLPVRRSGAGPARRRGMMACGECMALGQAALGSDLTSALLCVSSGKSFPHSERSFLLYKEGKVGSL